MKSEKNPAAVQLGRLGAKARNAALTAKQRREIATKASRAAAKKRRVEKARKEGEAE